MKIELFPVKTGKQKEHFPLAECVLASLRKAGLRLEDNDVLAVSSKFVAMSEDRIVKISSVVPKAKARKLAKKMRMMPEFAEIVLRESDAVLGGVRGFLLAVKDDIIAPNAGVDKSNVYPGHAILYPANPASSARRIRREILRRTGRKVGIVLTDSRLMPGRIGTSGVAVACAGIEPVDDCIGRKDLFGNTLRVTKRALADDIAAAAQLLMGEAAEAVPVVLVRPKSPPWRYTERNIKNSEMRISWKKDIYVAGLRK